MLRAVQTRSPLEEFEHGSFRSVLDDTVVDAVAGHPGGPGVGQDRARGDRTPRRERRDERSRSFASSSSTRGRAPTIDETLSRYPNLQEIFWLQEEPENMGAWPFVHLQMHSQFRGMNVGHVARAESASPATGQQPDPQRRAGRPR